MVIGTKVHLLRFYICYLFVHLKFVNWNLFGVCILLFEIYSVPMCISASPSFTTGLLFIPIRNPSEGAINWRSISA